MDPIMEEEQGWTMVNPFTLVFQLLANYGWYMVGVAGISIYFIQKLKPKYESWKQAKEDAEYHKDPDKSLSRMEAIQRARERQQEMLQAASQRMLEQQKEREERKRQEALERMQKYGGKSGDRLGSADDADYLPLSGGASTSSYRPPKRSACARGGCGR